MLTAAALADEAGDVFDAENPDDQGLVGRALERWERVHGLGVLTASAAYFLGEMLLRGPYGTTTEVTEQARSLLSNPFPPPLEELAFDSYLDDAFFAAQERFPWLVARGLAGEQTALANCMAEFDATGGQAGEELAGRAMAALVDLVTDFVKGARRG